jgi:uncharacterized protein (UPF0276 family)
LSTHRPVLGPGIGWRPELALAIDRRRGLGFVELIAEDFWDEGPPPAVEPLRQRGVAVVPHAISLSLGGAEPPDPARLERLAWLARRVQAPLVSEHLSFVRAGGLESGHLLPLPRTPETVEVVAANVRAAQAALPVPLALENVATLFEWPDGSMSEAEFVRAVLDRTGALLLLDIENVYANARNHGFDAVAYLDALPLDRIAYVHIAGGFERDGVWFDTHTCAVAPAVLDLLEELSARTTRPGVLLERDDAFPSEAELNAELDAIAAAVARGAGRREGCHVHV